jgi:hypothetical protein
MRCGLPPLELMTAGIGMVGEVDGDGKWEWIHFRSPGGYLLELASRI